MGNVWDILEKRAKMNNQYDLMYAIFLKQLHHPIFIKDGVYYYDGDEVCCKTKMFSSNQFNAVLHRTYKGKPFAQLTVNGVEYKIKVSKKNIIKKYPKIYHIEENKEMDEKKEIDINDRIEDLFQQISDYRRSKYPTPTGVDTSDLLIMNQAKNIIEYLTNKPVFTNAGVEFYEGDKVRWIMTGSMVDGILSYDSKDSSYYLKTDNGAKQYIEEYTRLVNLDREPLCEDKNGTKLFYGDMVIDTSITVFGVSFAGTIDIDAHSKVFITANYGGMRMNMYLPDHEFKYTSVEKMGDK